YLIAGTERGRRTFRVDRIDHAEATAERFERPEDFTLKAAWDEVVTVVEETRSRTWATVLIEDRFVPILCDHFGRHCHVDHGVDRDDGWVRVRVGAPTSLDIARTLAGWGAQVEVVDPPSLQVELARIGAELATRYTQHQRRGHSRPISTSTTG